MDDNYLRQRTDEILRERIRLGMTGGEYMPGEELIDIRYAMDPRRGGVSKTWERVRRCRRNPPKKIKTMEKCVSARTRLRSSLMKKKDLGKRETKMLQYLEKELKSKGKSAKSVKKAPRKKPTRRIALPGRLEPTYYEKCRHQPNPWLEFLCQFRHEFGGDPSYKGMKGQKKLLKNASKTYPAWRKHYYGYGEGGVLIGGEDY